MLQKHKLLVNVVCVYFNQEQLLAERRADIEEVTEEMKQLSSAAMEEMLESLRQEQAGDCFIQLFSRVRVFCDRCKLVGPILLYCEMFILCLTLSSGNRWVSYPCQYIMTGKFLSIYVL